jgi:hypothetical protein
MGARTRDIEYAESWRKTVAERDARAEAVRVVEAWNKTIAAGRDVWWSPTIRAAIVARACRLPMSTAQGARQTVALTYGVSTVIRWRRSGFLSLGCGAVGAAGWRLCRRSPAYTPWRRRL